MTVTLNIPNEAEQVFRDAWGNDLDRAALEALVIEGYRSRRFGLATVRRLLNLETRWDTEQWLGAHGVNWNYSLEDLESDRKTLDTLLPEG